MHAGDGLGVQGRDALLDRGLVVRPGQGAGQATQPRDRAGRLHGSGRHGLRQPPSRYRGDRVPDGIGGRFLGTRGHAGLEQTHHRVGVDQHPGEFGHLSGVRRHLPDHLQPGQPSPAFLLEVGQQVGQCDRVREPAAGVVTDPVSATRTDDGSCRGGRTHV